MARKLAETLQLNKTIIIFMVTYKHLNGGLFYLLVLPRDVHT